MRMRSLTLAAAILKLPARALVFGKTECQNSPEFVRSEQLS